MGYLEHQPLQTEMQEAFEKKYKQCSKRLEKVQASKTVTEKEGQNVQVECGETEWWITEQNEERQA